MEGDPPTRLLPWAHPADIVRSHQKDEHCRGLLRRHVCEAVEEVVGHRRASRWLPSLALLSDVAYAVASAAVAGRTLGEEYCELLVVTSGLRAVSPERRLTSALLAIFPPAVLAWLAPSSGGLRPGLSRLRRRLQQGFIAIAKAAPPVLRLHLAIFYLTGAFRHVSDRLTGLQALSISERPYRQFSYRPLGVLMIAQLLGQTFAAFIQWRKARSNAENDATAAAAEFVVTAHGPTGGSLSLVGNGSSEGLPTCRICMCPAEHTTSTPCGHLFCWDCIGSWCAAKASCPLCRASAPPQQLLPLLHYAAAPLVTTQR
mmetsp:Transcript_112377/g.223303  ORF Transcript_112377/g.223303 Transcript_112377/m.223303 type:complete len:315 (-) Transcript_112377:7-951(-)